MFREASAGQNLQLSTPMKTILKYLVLTIIAGALGLLPAYAYHLYEVNTYEEPFYSGEWQNVNSDASMPDSLKIMGANTVDFGTVEADQTYTQEILIQNDGNRDIDIWCELADGAIAKPDLSTDKITLAVGSSYPIEISLDGSAVTGTLKESFIIKSDVNDVEITVTGSKAE